MKIKKIKEILMSNRKNRVLALAVCLALGIGLLTAPAAAQDETGEIEPAAAVSDEMVALIQGWEGFVAYRTGGYIGYGTAVPAGAYPNGITTEEADALLRETLAGLADQIIPFFAARGVTLNQQQLDALVSLAYNAGTIWLSDAYRIVQTIVSGDYTAHELASALGIWCHVGTAVSAHLAARRAAEAAIFLYGDYTGTGEQFCYVIYDAGAGTTDADIYFYETGTAYPALPDAVREGYTLAGWYLDDGTRLAEGMTVEENLTVTAQWLEGNALPEEPASDGAASDETAAAPAFSDAPADAWYAGYVADLAAAGVVSGYADGTFRPDGMVNRAQALKLVLLAAGYPAQDETGEAGWAAGYYALAVSNGILAEDRWTDLSAPATRLDLAELAAAALRLDTGSAVSPFSDTASAAAAALFEAGIFNGADDGSGNLIFSPDATLTRSHACAVIWRILAWRTSSDALEGD